jgi:hypothetical protein
MHPPRPQAPPCATRAIRHAQHTATRTVSDGTVSLHRHTEMPRDKVTPNVARQCLTAMPHNRASRHCHDNARPHAQGQTALSHYSATLRSLATKTHTMPHDSAFQQCLTARPDDSVTCHNTQPHAQCLTTLLHYGATLRCLATKTHAMSHDSASP